MESPYFENLSEGSNYDMRPPGRTNAFSLDTVFKRDRSIFFCNTKNPASFEKRLFSVRCIVHECFFSNNKEQLSGIGFFPLILVWVSWTKRLSQHFYNTQPSLIRSKKLQVKMVLSVIDKFFHEEESFDDKIWKICIFSQISSPTLTSRNKNHLKIILDC